MFSPKYDNLPHNSGQILKAVKFFNTRRCPLFRGLTIFKKNRKFRKDERYISYIRERYYMSLQMDVGQDLIYIFSPCIYSQLLMSLFSN